MPATILETIKESIGVELSNLAFDPELLMHINSVRSNLTQLGVTGFEKLIDERSVYPSLATTALDGLVRHYILVRTKRGFDPTASETIAKSLDNASDELEGRILHEVGNLDAITNYLIASNTIVVPALGRPYASLVYNNLISNPDFSSWTNDNPDNWTVGGEYGPTAEVSEVGAGQNHGGNGTGYCNLYVADSTVDKVSISQNVLTPFTQYWGRIVVNTLGYGTIVVKQNQEVIRLITSQGTYDFGFIATFGSAFSIETTIAGGEPRDVTLERVELYK